jgi:hypothetical protein
MGYVLHESMQPQACYFVPACASKTIKFKSFLCCGVLLRVMLKTSIPVFKYIAHGFANGINVESVARSRNQIVGM